MGRALRRQQERAQRRQQRQQQSARPSARQLGMTAPATPEARSGGRRFVPRWVSDIVSELRKVTWPSRQEVFHLSMVVVVVSVFFGAILGAADLGFNWLIENTVLR